MIAIQKKKWCKVTNYNLCTGTETIQYKYQYDAERRPAGEW